MARTRERAIYKRQGRCVWCGKKIDARGQGDAGTRRRGDAATGKGSELPRRVTASVFVPVSVPSPASPLRCARCLAWNRQHQRARYARLRQEGCCVQCGQGAADAGYARCAACRQYMREYHRRYQRR
jgi:hypothetical protein